MTKRA